MVVRVGIFGAGTVGGAVIRMLLQRKPQVEIARVCVRDVSRHAAAFAGDGLSPDTFTSSFDDILNDASVDVILELIGGTTHAKDIVFRAISSGKHVVTANKALVAAHLDEISSLLEANKSVRFGFEAAVGGGIPVINCFHHALKADSVNMVVGILNGTTNFILSKMEGEGADFGTVLKEAQDLGYAEADPTADVEGHDVRSKISILAKLAFGATVDVATVPTMGIADVTATDFAYADQLDSTIKLLGVAKRIGNDDIVVYVSPMVVPRASAIATTGGATNIVEVRSDSLGKSCLVGQGAGALPTANSVMSDFLAVIEGRQSTDVLSGPSSAGSTTLRLADDYDAPFYIRIRVKDALGIIRAVGEVCEKWGVSIHAVLQIPIVDVNNVRFVIRTERAKLSQVRGVVSDVANLPFCLEKPFAIPLYE